MVMPKLDLPNLDSAGILTPLVNAAIAAGAVSSVHQPEDGAKFDPTLITLIFDSDAKAAAFKTALSAAETATVKAQPVRMFADKLAFSSSASSGAIITAISQPYGPQTVFSTVGTVPGALKLVGSTVQSEGAAVAGTTYPITIRATPPSGKRAIEQRFVFSATGIPPIVPYSTADKLFFSNAGSTRLPNKSGAMPSGAVKYGSYHNYSSGMAWDVPAGGKVVLGYTNFIVLEANATQHEQQIANDATIEACSLVYADDQGTTRIVMGNISNGGVLSSTVANGGVIVSFTLPAKLPKNTNFKIGLALDAQVNGQILPAGGDLMVGDTCRKHATVSFASTIASNAALTANSGASTTNLSGFYMLPSLIAATGSDGRPVLFNEGDSINFGKATPEAIAPARVAGIIDVAMARSVNGYQIPTMNVSIAGSGFDTTDPVRPEYNPNIRNMTRALVDQVTTMNAGTPPFSHFASNHGTNSIKTTGALQVALVKTRIAWLKAWYDKPVIWTTMVQKATSSDGFRTLANQSVGSADVSTATRFTFNDALLANKLDGTVAYAVNTYSALAYDQSTNRDKFAIAPFTATLTRDIAASASTIYLNAAPSVGANLVMDPLGGSAQARIVTSVTAVTPDVEYQVVTAVGSSNGLYPARTAGTTVGEIYTGDGQPATLGLHITRIANERIAAWSGANSFDQLKADLRTAVAGAWV